MVDILCHVEDAFLHENRVNKGIMQLIDLERATELYSLMGSAGKAAGGSAAEHDRVSSWTWEIDGVYRKGQGR